MVPASLGRLMLGMCISRGASEATPPAPLCIGTVIVDPPLLQAPMAKFTNFAFRQILRRFGGVGLAATEMVSARSFLELDSRGEPLPERLWGVRDEARPLAVQIWDNDPAALADVGRVWAEGEESSELHAAGGGGLWLSFFEERNTASLAIASGAEGARWYLRTGLTF